MQPNRTSSKTSLFSVLAGFLLLFFLYHIPEFLQRHSQQPLLLLLEVCMLFVVVLFFFILSQQNKKPLYDSGLSGFKLKQRNLYIGLTIGMLLTIGSNFLSVLLHWNSISITKSFSAVLGQTLMFAAGTFLPSLSEDLLTRAYLWTHRPKGWNSKRLVLFSAFIYTFNHIFRLNKPDVLLYLFVLGILLMTCLVLTRSLWLTLGIHWGSNIAYQFFVNIATLNTLKETGFENYLLAGFYVIGILIIMLLHKMQVFVIAEKDSSV